MVGSADAIPTITTAKWWANIWGMFESIFKRNEQKGQQLDKDSISQEFREQIKTATALLNFLLREGPADHIPDQIIDEIEAAQEYLNDSNTPSTEQRAKFLKAYRDLVNTPRYSIRYVNVPPTPLLEC